MHRNFFGLGQYESIKFHNASIKVCMDQVGSIKVSYGFIWIDKFVAGSIWIDHLLAWIDRRWHQNSTSLLGFGIDRSKLFRSRYGSRGTLCGLMRVQKDFFGR